MTTIDDLNSDVLLQILCKVDGPTLANISSANSTLRSLAIESQLWQNLCFSSWPSLRHLLPSLPISHRAFFSDAYPFPSLNPTVEDTETIEELLSAVDIHHKGELIFSKSVSSETQSQWFLSSPFQLDVLDRKNELPHLLNPPTSTPISPEELTLSWIIVNPKTLRAVNLSSRRPVSVGRHWYTGETQIRYAVVLDDCVVSALLTCSSEKAEVVEVSLTVEGNDGLCLNGKNSLKVVGKALDGGRNGDWKEDGIGKLHAMYWECERRKKEIMENKVRREWTVDMMLVLFGMVLFFSFFIKLRFF